MDARRRLLVWLWGAFVGVVTLAFCAVMVALAHKPKAQPIYPVDRFGMLWAQLPPEAWVQEAHQKLAQNAWIDRRTDSRGQSCCYAMQDCHPVPADDVLSHRDGVQLSPRYFNLVIPGPQIQVSEDGRYWLCAQQLLGRVRMRCFFAPWQGSFLP